MAADDKYTIKEDTSSDKSPNREAGGMHVKVYSPFHVYFDGEAVSISAENDTGTFDILGRHKNFLTLLRPGDVTVRTGRGDDEKIPISNGIMHVKADEVIVFLDV